MGTGARRWDRDAKAGDNPSPKIAALFRRDQIWAWAVTIGLWATVAFVLWWLRLHVTDSRYAFVILLAAMALVIANTLAVSAMLSHYREDLSRTYNPELPNGDR